MGFDLPSRRDCVAGLLCVTSAIVGSSFLVGVGTGAGIGYGVWGKELQKANKKPLSLGTNGAPALVPRSHPRDFGFSSSWEFDKAKPQELAVLANIMPDSKP